MRGTTAAHRFQLALTREHPTAGERLSANLNWTLPSFAIVFPLTFSLNEAFKRRELALLNLAQMKARSPSGGAHDQADDARSALAVVARSLTRHTCGAEQPLQHLPRA